MWRSWRARGRRTDRGGGGNNPWGWQAVQLPSGISGNLRELRLDPESAVNSLEQTRKGTLSDLERDPLRVTVRPYEIYWIEVTE